MADYITDDVQAARLADRHKHSLLHESGIDPDVIAERGVRTVRRFSEVPTAFSRKQRRKVPGILFTVHRPNGKTSCVLRPDEPDPDQPGRKYEQPPKRGDGPGNFLDVHPSLRSRVDDLAVPVVFTEGIKKADSITSAAQREGTEVLTVGITGTWNWMSGGEAIPDMHDIPVDGRRVYVCFDSDMLRNPNVQMAAERLAEHLTSRGAEVRIVYLPDRHDGSKMGADDFLAGGGTLAELLALARPFDPDNIQRERLSRDERLRLYLEDLRRQHDGMPSQTRRECSTRAAWRACLTMAERHGRPVEDGMEVERLSSRIGAELAAMGHVTFARRMNDLIDQGLVRRVERERSEHADVYVLLVRGSALLKQGGDGGGNREEEGAEGGGVTRGVSETRAQLPEVPELREPYVLAVREKDEGGRLREVYERVERLGKQRGEVVRQLLENGGSATIPELMGRCARPTTRPRDFKRRRLADLMGFRRQHKGDPLSVGPPIIEVEGDTVRLVDGWLDALEKHRELGGEQDAADQQRIRHELQRMGYREHLAGRTQADPAPTEEEMEERRKRRQHDRAAMIGSALVRLFAEDPAHRELYPDQMAEAIAQMLPEDFPRNAAPYGKPKPEEVVEFLENHVLPVPTPIYARYDRDAERRFREMERAAQESFLVSPFRESREPEVEASPAPGPDGVIRHGPECACWICGDAPVAAMERRSR